ncbi:MAG: 50S ribosomal protein L29 [Lysobacterales bacterium]
MAKKIEKKPKTAADFQKELLDLRREQFNLRMQKGAGELTKTHQVRNVRREIARTKHQLANLSQDSLQQVNKT